MTAGQRGDRFGALTDVAGVRVGHAERVEDGWLTGVTVVLPPEQTVGAVDVRGGGPGTHETDALAPGTLVQTVDAVTLTGGSAHGLASVGGVRRWCEQAGVGFEVGPTTRVPIVPAAAVFDLGRGGDPTARPDEAMGYAAAAAAEPGVSTGCVGAGTGTVLAGGQLKGGVGTASMSLPGGVVVAALVVANAAGSPLLPESSSLLAASLVRALRPEVELPAPGVPGSSAAAPSPPGSGPSAPAGPSGAPGSSGPPESSASAGSPESSATSGLSGPSHTTLAVVATNARLDRAETRRMAVAGHDGLARALRPVHTLTDGDTVFGLATGACEARAAAPTDWPGAAALGGLVAVQSAAADVVLLATVDAVLSAWPVSTPAGTIPAYAS